MNPLVLEYKIMVWDFLEKMEPGKKYTIEKLCRKENRETFVEAIKEYMHSFPWNGCVTFNQDYSKIYRVHPPVIKNSK